MGSMLNWTHCQCGIGRAENVELDAIQMLIWADFVPSSKLTKQLP